MRILKLLFITSLLLAYNSIITFSQCTNDVTPPNVITIDKQLELGAGNSVTLTTDDINFGSSDNCNIKSLGIVGQVVYTCADVCGIAYSGVDQGYFGQWGWQYGTDVAQSFTVGSDGILFRLNVRFDNNMGWNQTFTLELFKGDDPSTAQLISTQEVDIIPNEASISTIELANPIQVHTGEKYLIKAIGLSDQLEARTTVGIDYAGGDFWTKINDAWTIVAERDLWFGTELGTTDCSTVELIVKDDSDNEASATAIVFVKDATAPTIITHDVFVGLDGSGNPTSTVNEIDNGSYDNCGIFSRTIVGQSGTTSAAITGDAVETIDQGGFSQWGFEYAVDMAQSFAVGFEGSLSKVEFYCDNNTGTDLPLTLEILKGRTPDDAILVTSQQVTITPNVAVRTAVTLNEPFYVSQGQQYILHLKGLSADLEGRSTVGVDYAAGDFWLKAGGNWVKQSGNDMYFISHVKIGGKRVEFVVTDVHGNESREILSANVSDHVAPSLSGIQDITVQIPQGETEYLIYGSEFDPLVEANCGVYSLSNDLNNYGTLNNYALNQGMTQITWTLVDNTGAMATKTINVQVDVATTIDEEEFFDGIKMYPNPVSNILQLELGELEVQQLTITNLSGKVMLIKKEVEQFEELDLSSFASGFYIVNVVSKNGTISQKIVKN